MRNLFRIIAILGVVILLISSVYFVFFMDSEEDTHNDKEDDQSDDNPNSSEDNQNDTDDNNGQDQFKESVHTVFIEEGTGTWCKNCPNVAGILYELYESGNYNFYYVSMIEDKNTKAKERLEDDYNIYGYPTAFIDGGYKIISSSLEPKSVFADAIENAESREVPQIRVTVKAIYNNNTDILTTNVLVENNESNNYDGRLRVYLTEKVSQWVNPFKADDGKTKPYHFGFLDYIINKDIIIDAKGNLTETKETDLSDLDPEEVMIIAVVFSSESVKKESYPQDNKGEFDAHYADATDATELVEGGNLPPTVGLTLPELGKVHLFGNPLFKTYFGNTILIGKTTIEAISEDDEKVEKVEFYIDNELVHEDKDEPYEYSFRKIDSLKHILRLRTIRILAYDAEGKTSTAQFDVIAIFL